MGKARPPPFFLLKNKLFRFFKKKNKKIEVFFIIFLIICGIESISIICDTWPRGNWNMCRHYKVGDMEVR
jgi:hypothetical protein